jgi:hypothetical protein
MCAAEEKHEKEQGVPVTRGIDLLRNLAPEPEFVDVKGAQESIPTSLFRLAARYVK